MSILFVPRVGGVLSAGIAVPEHEREVPVDTTAPLVRADWCAVRTRAQ
jgi:hypothetical protein